VEKIDRTKLLLSKTLKELSSSIPLRSVTVQKLVFSCGVNRGIFYYHFKDIQDLINWTYHVDVTVPTHEFIMNCSGDETLYNISRFVLRATYREKEF